MEDVDIYELAAGVLLSIKNDLANGIYAELHGSLDFTWSTDSRVSAWAESAGDYQEPPRHKVVICYELARQLYRDVEAYHAFAKERLFVELNQTVFRDFDPKPHLPDHMVVIDSIRNMYIGALTWVFFHELGHLMQEHGYIRAMFNGGNVTTRIEDCESDGMHELEGRPAIISHVTEFAADVEATQWCVQELARHFLSADVNTDEQSEREFHDNLYLLECGISCALYRFQGGRAKQPEEHARGSHPTPVRRLEVCLPNIFEKLDSGGHGKELHGLSRNQLVHLCTGAAYSAGFFWLWRYAEVPGIPDNFMAKGLLQDPFKATYWRDILIVWEELEPEIRKIRRFGGELGMLSFTTEFRSEIFANASQSMSQ